MFPSHPNDSAQSHPPKLSSITSTSDSQKASEASSDVKMPDNTGALDLAGPSPLQFTEAFKRRRIGDEPAPQQQKHKGFDSDAVKALFRIEPSSISSSRLRKASDIPFMAPSYHPDARSEILPLLNIPGTISQDVCQNSLPGLSGHPNNTGKPAAIEATPPTASMTRDTNVTRPILAPPFNGIMIPGLGAPFKRPEHEGIKSDSVTACELSTELDAFNGCGLQNDLTRNGSRSSKNPASQILLGAKPSNMAAGRSESHKPSPHKPDSPVSHMMSAPCHPELVKSLDHASSEGSASTTESQGVALASDVVKPSEPDLPSGPPPVWMEKQIPRTFKLSRVLYNPSSETFRGAYKILGNLNSGHYQMPYGSRVVAIKCSSLDDILLSFQTGLWATNRNVMTRIMELHESHPDPSTKTLLLWSIPGSKHFCGLAELQSYDPEVHTDFIDKDEEKMQGAMVINWLYCKLVPFDDVNTLVEGKIDQVSVTQMWNGMHYTEATGREVVKRYIEAPHVENLLAAPTSMEFFRRALQNSTLVTARVPPPKYSARGGPRPQQHVRGQNQGFGRKGRVENGRSENAAQPQSPPPAVGAVQNKETNFMAQAKSVSPEKRTNSSEPKLELMHVYKHADGSLTTAPDINGNVIPITPVQTGYNASFPQQSASLAQSQSIHSQQSSSVRDPLRTTVTTGSSFPSQDRIIHGKFGSFFNENGNGVQDRPHNAMPPPLKPSSSQCGTGSSGEGVRLYTTPRSIPRGNRFDHNIRNWSYGSPEKTFQPQTPVRQSQSSYDLSTSPMDLSTHSTPTPRRDHFSRRKSHVSPQDDSVYGYGQVPKQFRTPGTSPETATVQPDTPRPATGRRPVHSTDPNTWVDQLVNNE